MRAGFAVGLLLMLAAFSPPAQAPVPEPSQQTVPKSWIPEKKPEQAPPITLDVPPRQASAYSHATGLTCSSQQGGLAPSARNFVEGYAGGMAALEAGRFEEAIGRLEGAAGYARSAREWTAIEMMRIRAFSKLGNDAELIASIEALLAMKECLPEDRLQEYRRMLEQARERLTR